MTELCERDMDARANGRPLEFILDEIIETCLGAFSKEYVFNFVSKFETELGCIEVLQNNRIRLTSEGRKYCH